MKPRLSATFVPHRTPNASSDWSSLLDVLAEALAGQLIDEARAEIAAELGVPEEDLERESAPHDLPPLDARWPAMLEVA